jgi:glutamate-ammonia-ligase adenylyltransferase
MEALSPAFVASLESGAPDRKLLAIVGEEDCESAAAAFLAAIADRDLAPFAADWCAALLRSARPGFGARCLAELAALRREAGRPLDLGRTPALPRVLGNSGFLARRLLRHPDWVDELAGDPPAAPPTAPPSPDWTAIRTAKYRGLLRIAARDLCGRPFADSLRELSDLADGCLVAALDCTANETAAPAPALLALGKLGGRELNFSSDVDLIFVYQRDPMGDERQQHQQAEASIRTFKTHLEQPSVDGFGYRVDLDLRPEGRSGVLSNSVGAALNYYEAFGAEWERQMLIRLRAVAGPADTGAAFCDGIAPFVYRRLIDPGVMQTVRNMKQRIERERLEHGRDLEADLKEGPGGIRDIEFIVQSFQLFFGGRHSELRTGNVLAGLGALEQLELLPTAVTAALADAYLWLRRAEHAVQLPEEQQTAQVPHGASEQTALARRMGYADAAGADARARLQDDWLAVRTETRRHFEALVLGEEE